MKQPKLRFPEFTGDWKQHKFEDVVTIGSGKDYKHLESGNVPVYGTGGYMLSVNQALSENEDAVGIGRKGTIDKPYILRAPFWTVDTLFYCIPNKGFDLTFTNCLFQNVDWKKKDESTGVPSLSKVIINNVKTYVPSLEEQQKIASLFTEIDTLIQSAENELEGYRELKQGMLQKMFPKNGETVPEIRFPGFTDDWKQHKVRDFAVESEVKGHSGKDAKKLTVKLHNKGVYVADEKTQGSDNTQYYIRRAGQFIYGKQNFFNGAIGIVPEKLDKYESTKDVPAFDIGSDVNVDWLYYYIARPEIYKPQEALCTGTGSKRFHVNNFYDLSLAIPKMDEQIKIKEYFIHLDNLITLQQEELDGYKELKKGLLQQMFC